MTSPSPPMSGTLITSLMAVSSAVQRVGFVRVQTEGGLGLDQYLGLQLAVLDQRRQGGVDDPATVDFEEVAQLAAAITAAEAISTQRLEIARYPLADLLGIQLHVVGSGDDRPAALGQVLLDVGQARCVGRVQAVPALHVQAVATQFVEAGDAPDIGADTVILLQNFRGFADFAQNGTAAHQLDMLLAFLLGLIEQIHAAD